MSINRYQNGKIYAIKSPETKMVYIGSTCGNLRNRLSKHKSNLKSYLNGNYCYTTSYEIVKYNNSYIELLENHSCNTKEELNRREGQIMRATENCVNKYIIGRRTEEYKQQFVRDIEDILIQRRTRYNV